MRGYLNVSMAIKGITKNLNKTLLRYKRTACAVDLEATKFPVTTEKYKCINDRLESLQNR